MHLLDGPQRIVIELTPKCNLLCPMCPRNYIKEKDGYISKTLWNRLIDEIFENYPQSIILPFWRGESLLHPDFMKLMEYALDKSLRIHIATNGTLVANEFIEVLLRCEFVTFSIHNEVGYKTAREFLELKRGIGPTTQISFVKGEKDVEGICNSLILSDNLGGFDSVRIYYEHTKDGIFGSSGLKVNSARNYCPKLQNTLVIAYDGSISRCNHIWTTDKEINLNNLSIREAWHSDYLKKIRNAYPDSRCQPCDQWIGHTLGESYRITNGKVKHKVFSASGVSDA